MHYIYQNINAAYHGLLQAIGRKTIKTFDVANQEEVRIAGPVTLTIRNPLDRFLFMTHQVHRFNPFHTLHMMLQQIAPTELGESSDFFSRYGYRARGYEDLDAAQLLVISDTLFHLPQSQTAVLSFWTPSDVTVNANKQSPTCLFAQFEIVNHRLQMTVYSRSVNLYQLFGTELFMMFTLHDFLAAKIGIKVGKYNHILHNMLVSRDVIKLLELAGSEEMSVTLPGELDLCNFIPVVKDWKTFDDEIVDFVSETDSTNHRRYEEPFLQEVAQPLSVLFDYMQHEENFSTKKCDKLIDKIGSPDWRLMVRGWNDYNRYKNAQ